MKKLPIAIGFFALLILGFAFRWVLMQYHQPPELQTSYLFPEPRKLKPFSMVDHNGESFSNQHLTGSWSLFFAGFTSCPDICPTTMGKLSAAYPKLIEHAPLQILFLSVDPARDSVTKIKQYLSFFNPRFVGLRAEHKALFPLTRDLGMIYAMVGEGESYTVDHSASMVLISPKGEKVAVIKPKSENNQLPDINIQALIADVHAIQSYL